MASCLPTFSYDGIFCPACRGSGCSPTPFHSIYPLHTDKKENQIFLIYREIQSGAVAKSYMRKGFLIYEQMGKYFPIYEEAVSHMLVKTA
jgi:hypothetical protein